MDESTIRSLETAGVFPTGERQFKGVNVATPSLRKTRRAQAKRDRKAATQVLREMNRELRSLADRKGVRLSDFPKPVGRSPILGDLLDWLEMETFTDESGAPRFRDKK